MGIRSQNNTNPLAAYLDVFSSTGTESAAGAAGGDNFGAPTGLTATGGIISDYVATPGDVYRAHVFTSSGTFAVSALSGSFPAAVDYLVVAGGGGGAVGGDYTGYQAGGGGGGAGGLLVSPGFPGVPTSQNQGTAMTVSAGPTTYTVTIGGGGVSGVGAPTVGTAKGGKKGADSVLSGPDITTITANGGGGGAGNSQPAQGGSGYGSGGGGEGAYSPATFRAAAAGGSYPGPTQQGFPGGTGSTSTNSPSIRTGGGGGGAGAAGIPGSDAETGSTEGDGGLGLQVLIAGNAPAAAIGTPGPSGTGWVAQGGHGGGYNNEDVGVAPQPAGGGGGDGGLFTTYGSNGSYGTGGGGGGSNAETPGTGRGGIGGSGIVVIRYQIGKVTAGAKATGGNISFYNNKTIHAFTNTGDFNNTSGANLTGCEVVILGGGGGGGCWQGGAGGSGRFYRNDDVTLAPGPNAVTIGAGGRGGTVNGEGGAVGSTGTESVFNSVTMPAGGGGAKYDAAAGNGGSGGGGAGGPGATGTAPAGNINAVTNVDTPGVGAGNAGGDGQTAAPHGAGGGGGVGGTGFSGGSGNGGPGGLGVRLPSTFRNPITSIGYLSDGVNHFVGGGGGGGAGPPNAKLGGGGGGAPTVPGPKQVADGTMPVADQATYQWAGAGTGIADWPGGTAFVAPSAFANSGSGGGGNGSGYPSTGQFGGNGGSGIVLIAYPS